ncbi:MAG: alpha/beta hydrolase [Bacteroidota bacterium]
MKKFLLRFFIFLITFLIIVFFIAYQADIPVDKLKEKYANGESNFIQIESVNAHYRIEGKGRPLVLLHGTGASLHTWDGWVAALKDSFQIIRMDLPAFGLTGPNEKGDYSIKSYRNFLNSFFRQLQIDTFYLAGNSLGGRIAWDYSVAYPDQVKKLVLLDAAGAPNDRGEPAVFKLAKNPFTAFLLKNILPKSFIEKNIKEVYFDQSKITQAIIDRYHALALRTGNRQAFIDRTKTPYSDASGHLAKINCPTFIMWGEHDQWVPVEDAYFFEKEIPDNKLKIYDNAGHVPMEEIPEETARDAEKFLLNN